MKLSEFDFELPESCIAQEPASCRDGSRLMVPGAAGEPSAHLAFTDLPGLLRPGDLLVLNDTRVRPARLYGRRPTGGRVELLLLDPADDGPSEWWALLKVRRRPPAGEVLELEGGLQGDLVLRRDDCWRIRLTHPQRPVEQVLQESGHMPLPPYIRRDPADLEAARRDRERYQTVFARSEGAVAAPTAGLHFTPRLLDRVRAAGARIATLTLHVGVGTFLPVRTKDLDDHEMHAEAYVLPRETVDAIRTARDRGGRVIAVGTTVVRTLEGCAAGAAGAAGLEPGHGRCSLFIRPGHRFQVIDAMITNFHLPQSTLLVLVSAFAGRERILAAYREAVEHGYRFYSYGDAMFLTP